MLSTKKTIGTVAFGILAVITGVKGYSFYNKLKNAVNNIQFMFSFVQVNGLIGSGITKFTNPVLQVIFELQVKNLSDFNVNATNIVATIQQQSKDLSWNNIAQTENQFIINAPAKGGSSKINIPINFKGLSTLSSVANIKSNYRALITYQYRGTSLQHKENIPLQQYIKLAIDNLKSGLNLKGIEANTTLTLAG